MKFLRNRTLLVVVICLLVGAVFLATNWGAGRDRAAKFDYYALALSWSPTYCASKSGRGDNQQCGGRRYAFVVHGLWPQFESGWPEKCQTDQRYVPNRLIEAMLPIMPSKRLIIHEWRKHGTCSGLVQENYFALTAKLFSQIKIPARYLSPQQPLEISSRRLVEDFVKTNGWLTPDMISVQCGNSRDRATLRELRICFTPAGKPRACGKNERRQCAAKTLVLPPVR